MFSEKRYIYFFNFMLLSTTVIQFGLLIVLSNLKAHLLTTLPDNISIERQLLTPLNVFPLNEG